MYIYIDVNVWQRTQVYTMLQVNLVEMSRGHVSNWFHETLDEYKLQWKSKETCEVWSKSKTARHISKTINLHNPS